MSIISNFNIKKILYLLFCFIISSILQIKVRAAERNEFYNGIRSLGMGGAVIAVVNDETALISNPAGLGKIRDYFVTLFDPEIHIGEQTMDLIQTQPLDRPFDPQLISDTLNKTASASYHFKSQVFPSIVVPNFGIGVLFSYFANGEVDSAGNTLSMYYRHDVATTIGYNFRLLDGRLKLGIGFKYITREEATKTVAAGSNNITISDVLKTSAGMSTDIGLILAAPWATLPTLSLMIHDFGGTKFDLTNSSGSQADSISQTVDAAFAFFPIALNRVRYCFTVEYRDILNQFQETDEQRRLHAGFEANIGDLLFIRLGSNQGYWTSGLEFSTKHWQFQFATYGEDVGTSGASKEDRRYVTKFAFRL